MSSIDTEAVRNRKSNTHTNTNGSAQAPPTPVSPNTDEHPMGAPKHGPGMQFLRILGFGIYFFGSGIFIHFAQLLGIPLYFISKDWFYAYMALTKQYFGLLVTTMTQWWSPTVVRITGDKSMAGLLTLKSAAGNGSDMLQVDLGERVVLMANHQIYTDWLYLWWIAYTNAVPMHGHIYIILKDSLKWVPLIGPAMQFYSFIFMARKWSKDQERLRHSLRKLNSRHSGPLSGSQGGAQLDPMWLMIFPEGTNLSANTRESSGRYAAKAGMPDLRHEILPRSTGLQFCLQELKDTVPYLYDCTIAYGGIPPGGYGQDIFTLRSVYFQGRPPKSVNMHWRRFAIKDIPYNDHDKMYEWVLQRWREKDALIETFMTTGSFPGTAEGVNIEGGKEGLRCIYTEVKPRSPFEFLAMFGPVVTTALVGRIGVQILDSMLEGYSRRPVKVTFARKHHMSPLSQASGPYIFKKYSLAARLNGATNSMKLLHREQGPTENMKKTSRCVLLELPTELCLRIHELVWSQMDGKVVQISYGWDSSARGNALRLPPALCGSSPENLTTPNHSSALLRTCSKVYEEAVQVLFQNVICRLQIDHGDLDRGYKTLPNTFYEYMKRAELHVRSKYYLRNDNVLFRGFSRLGHILESSQGKVEVVHVNLDNGLNSWTCYQCACTIRNMLDMEIERQEVDLSMESPAAVIFRALLIQSEVNVWPRWDYAMKIMAQGTGATRKFLLYSINHKVIAIQVMTEPETEISHPSAYISRPAADRVTEQDIHSPPPSD